MRDLIFSLSRGDGDLRGQIRKRLVAMVLDGALPPRSALPAVRKLAKQLGVGRNTVELAYDDLVDEGFLVSMERSGYYVADSIATSRQSKGRSQLAEAVISPDWGEMLQMRPSANPVIERPRNWHTYPYPFVYGQIDPNLFPYTEWRKCNRDGLGRAALKNWASDNFSTDDPLLVEQIRTNVLPRRGVLAQSNEILITLGAQNALFLLASLLVKNTTVVGVENPGYAEARNIFGMFTEHVRPLQLDHEGMIVDRSVNNCSVVYTTPSHQCPTAITMPLSRRLKLIRASIDHNMVIIEDDYEPECNFCAMPTSALLSLNTRGRVIYVGSFSKSLGPGLRLGFIVGPPPVIEEARALRRLMLRHTPANNQRTLGLFIANGYYDTLLHKKQRVLAERWQAMDEALTRHRGIFTYTQGAGGTSYWVQVPDGLDTEVLAVRALERGIIVEPGALYFCGDQIPRYFLRIGYSSIPIERIRPGIDAIAKLVSQLLGE